MNQNIKKTVSVWILIILFVTLSVPVSAFAPESASVAPNYELNTSTVVSDSFIKNQASSNIAYTQLLESFANSAENTFTATNSSYTVSGISANGFPEYYGGAYINTDGNLVILLTGNLSESAKTAAKDDIVAITENNDIVFGTASNSYRDLVSAMADVANYVKSDQYSVFANKNATSITSYSLDDYQNRVVIGIEADNSTKANNACDLLYSDIGIDSKYIVIESDGSGAAFLDAAINCGSEIVANNLPFSSGFRAKYTSGGTTVYGFVTCGHGFYGGATTEVVSDSSGNHIGYLDATRHQFSGSVDASFVRLYTGSSITNTIQTGIGSTITLSTSGYISPGLGSVVYMYGKASGNVEMGYVESISYSDTFSSTLHPDQELTDLVMTSYQSQPGDSGGPVFCSTGSTTYTIAGTHVGHDSYFSYYCKAYNILTTFGLSVY